MNNPGGVFRPVHLPADSYFRLPRVLPTYLGTSIIVRMARGFPGTCTALHYGIVPRVLRVHV